MELKINEFIYSYRKIRRETDNDSEWEQINIPEEFIYAISCYALACQYGLGFTDEEDRAFYSDDFHEQVISYLNDRTWEHRGKCDNTEYCRIKSYREPTDLDILNGKEQYARLYWQIELDEAKYHSFHIYMRCLYYYLSFQFSSDKEKIEGKLKEILEKEDISELCIEVSSAIKCWETKELRVRMNALEEKRRVCRFIKNHCIKDWHSFRFND